MVEIVRSLHGLPTFWVGPRFPHICEESLSRRDGRVFQFRDSVTGVWMRQAIQNGDKSTKSTTEIPRPQDPLKFPVTFSHKNIGNLIDNDDRIWDLSKDAVK